MRAMISNKLKNNDEEYLNSFPPGFRFKPTDEELCSYLSSKIHGKQLPPNKIKVVNLYDYDPLTLTDISDNELFNGTNSEWYFFTPQNRKYPNGERPDRAAGEGFWKVTGAGKRIEKDDNSLIGLKKTLFYYKGKQPKGVKTNWIMHEYVLDNPTPRTRTGPNDMRLNDWVLCRVYNKVESEKKQKGETVNPEAVNPGAPSLVTEQNQEIVENSMANANEAVAQENATLSTLFQSQRFQGQDHNFNMMPEQTNFQMSFNNNGAFDDSTIGGIPEFPQPYHGRMLENGSTTFPLYDPVLGYNTSISTAPMPVSSITRNDDQLYLVDYDDLNITHQMPIVPNDASLTWTTPPPMTGMASDDQVHFGHTSDWYRQWCHRRPVSLFPPNDQSHRVNNDNLNIPHTTAYYDISTTGLPKSLMPPDDKQT